MNNVRYNVVFKGRIAKGILEQNARHNIAELLRLDSPTIEKLFSGMPVVLKKNVDLETAQRFKVQFEKTGALCSIESATRSHQPASPSVPHRPSSANAPTICPKCGFEQSASAECLKCGIIFAKYKNVSKRTIEPNRITATKPSDRSNEGRPIISRQVWNKPLSIIGLITLGILCLGALLLWTPTEKQEPDVRYNEKHLVIFRKNHGNHYRNLILTAHGVKASGKMNLVYGTCNASNPKAFIKLLEDNDRDNYDDICACIPLFKDATVIAPLLAWHASLDSAARPVEDAIKTLFLIIGEPSVSPLVVNLDTHSSPYTQKLIVETLALLNSETSIRSVVQMLQQIPQDLEPISKSFIAMVLCSKHLRAESAFHLAKDISQNGSPNTRRSIAQCMVLFEGEPVRAWVQQGTDDPDERVRLTYQRLQDDIDAQQRSKRKVAADREREPHEIVAKKKTHQKSIWDYTSTRLYCQSMKINNISPPPKKTDLTVKKFFKNLKKAGWIPEKKAAMTIKAIGKNSTFILFFERSQNGDVIISKVSEGGAGSVLYDPCLIVLQTGR